jgi:NAD(P)-dependent dehydrogenase (short-subunit alcohol dehydrogenase family)
MEKQEQTKIALVTGGSRGLGRDMALRLAEKGRGVVLTYHSQSDEAAKVVAAIVAMGGKAAALHLHAGDVSTFDDFALRLQGVLNDQFGAKQFDFLINNAGTGLTVPSFAATTEAQFDELMNLHYKGVFFLTQKMLPLLRDGGGIVNLSSGLTRFAYPGSGAYASMKGAIETLTMYLAKELGGRGIRANVVAPGAIATDFNGGRVRDNAQMQEHIKAVTALGRIGLADDIGGLVAFLCSDDARWITAQRIEASGGMHI